MYCMKYVYIQHSAVKFDVCKCTDVGCKKQFVAILHKRCVCQQTCMLICALTCTIHMNSSHCLKLRESNNHARKLL